MSATSRPEQHRWGFYAAVLAGCLALSMLGNATHAWSQWHADVAAGIDRGAGSPWGATVAITVAPAMVIVMTEMVVISHKRNVGRARALVAVLAVLVGLIALTVSYAGLVHVSTTIIGLPTWLGYAAPLIVDAPIIAATIGLWDVQQRIRADRVAAETAPTVANRGRSTTSAAVDEPVDGDRQADDDAVHEVPAAVVHEPVHKPSTVVDDARAQLAMPVDAAVDETAATVDDQTVDEVPATVDNRVVDEFPQVGAVDEPSLTVDGADDGAVHSAVDDRAQPLSTAGDEPVHITDDDASEPVDGDEALARAVVDAIRTKAAVDDVAAALRLRREGQSMTAIAAELGVGSHSTVSRWIKCAETLEPQPVG